MRPVKVLKISEHEQAMLIGLLREVIAEPQGNVIKPLRGDVLEAMDNYGVALSLLMKLGGVH